MKPISTVAEHRALSSINNNNKVRTLGRLAIIRAWFDLIEGSNPPRYAFRMDVAFQNERLGGGTEAPVRFRVALKRCEVVVVMPRGEAGLKIDPRTVATGLPPAHLMIKQTTQASSEVMGEGSLEVGPAGASGGVKFGAKAKRARSVEIEVTQNLPVLLGARSLSNDGHQSWNITRMDGPETLEGMLWDANSDEPRFELVDRRSESTREKEAANGLHASVTIEVRCKREDLQVDDIELSDPKEAKLVARLTNRNKAVKTAEAFIKKCLVEEGLHVGDIHEPYSDVVVGDMILSLVDDESF